MIRRRILQRISIHPTHRRHAWRPVKYVRTVYGTQAKIRRGAGWGEDVLFRVVPYRSKRGRGVTGGGGGLPHQSTRECARRIGVPQADYVG